MKRFFASAEAKPGAGGSPKRARGAEGHGLARGAVAPRTFLSWNLNGLYCRVKNNGEWSEFKQLVTERSPDAIALQEVRHPAEKRVAGGAARGSLGGETKPHKAERQEILQQLARAPFNQYKAYWSLADKKYSGTALLVKHSLEPSSVSFRLDGQSGHTEEGRVILAEYADLLLLTTYVPNNGTKADSFARRAAWEATAKAFVLAVSKPLVWLGDLNTTHSDADVSDAKFFGSNFPNADDPDNSGQPGFTPTERRRFGELLSEGGLVDTWRHLHPEPAASAQDAAFTWRGGNQPSNRYYQRGMRIDFSLVSSALLSRLTASTILGHGFDSRGFMGSDHSPIMLELAEPPGAAAQTEGDKPPDGEAQQSQQASAPTNSS